MKDVADLICESIADRLNTADLSMEFTATAPDDFTIELNKTGSKTHVEGTQVIVYPFAKTESLLDGAAATETQTVNVAVVRKLDESNTRKRLALLMREIRVFIRENMRFLDFTTEGYGDWCWQGGEVIIPYDAEQLTASKRFFGVFNETYWSAL